MKVSLGFILAISLAGLQFLAILSVVSTSYLTSEKALLQHARDLLVEVGANASEHSNGFLRPARDAAELASRVIESEAVTSADTALLENFLFQNLQNELQLSGIYYGDQAGNFLYVMRSDGPGEFRTKIVETDGTTRSTQLIWRDADFAPVQTLADPDDVFDPRERPWYKSVVANRTTIWTDPYVFFSSQQPGVTVASPVFSQGVLQGVIGVDIEISTISEFLSGLAISNRGSALILNENGDVIAHPDFAQVTVKNADGTLSLASISAIEDPVARSAFAGFAETGIVDVRAETETTFGFQNETYVSLLRPLEGTELPWTIAIYAPENDFIEAIRDNRSRNTWIAALISLVTALVGLALAGLILKPVRAFAVRTALVSQGEVPPSEPLPRTYNELMNANETLIREIAQRREADAKIRELSRDLSHISRVNLMGQMATGLAHELSQPLTAISQNVDSAISTAKQGENTNKDLLGILAELDEQAHRGGDILRALRAFVRKDQGEMAPFDLAELLYQTDNLLRNEAHEHQIEIKFDLAEIPNVIGNRTQIAQVLINLIRNGMESIEDANSANREIRISARLKGDTVEICVDDTGPGIDPAVTLFKQFETSKKNGMGLGLSICRTIIEANEGELWHDANCKDATRFCFTLRV